MDSHDGLSRQRQRYFPRSMSSDSSTSTSSSVTMKIPALPRFHPANFPSSQNSRSAKHLTVGGAVSPAQNGDQNQYSQAATQYYLSKLQMLAGGRGTGGEGDQEEKPSTPYLAPAGSPGPITPFELEDESSGYLECGTRSSENQKTPRRGQ